MTDRTESKATNDLVRDAMATIAARMGLDELPLNNPNINFYRVAANKLNELGFRGQNLEHAAYDLVGKLVYTITGREGALFHFPKYYERFGNKAYFDQYFLMGVNQKGRQLREQDVRQKSKGGLSITPGLSDEYGEISEGQIPGGESAYEEAAEADEVAKKERALRGIPSFLADRRGGEAMVVIWDMLVGREHTLMEMAEVLNEKGIPRPTRDDQKMGVGGEAAKWTGPLVYKEKVKIMNLVRQYLQVKGISVESSRLRRGNTAERHWA